MLFAAGTPGTRQWRHVTCGSHKYILPRLQPASSADALIAVYEAYGPLWDKLTPEAFDKITRGNYEHLFNQARQRVRAWETNNLQTRSKL
jgi:hypothetical protein